MPVYPRFRGRHKLHRFEDTGLEKCVGCSLCAAACPADCIRVVAAENTPENRVSAGERYAAVYEINMSRCIFCGYCEVACPFDAITMGHDYELSDYDRTRPDLHQGDAAGRAARAHAAADGGRVSVGWRTSSSSSPRSARSPARSAWSRCATRSTACSRWSCHLLSLAVLFLLLRAEFVAAAQVVVYAGAVMVLYVFVVAYVGGDERARCAGAAGARGALGAAVRRRRCSSSSDRPARHGPARRSTPTGRQLRAGLRHARQDRPAAADQLPVRRSRSPRSCC